MIQINLLPDVKREYLKAQQTKHLVIMISVFLTLITLVLTAVLFMYVKILQPQHRVNVQQDIDSGIAQLTSNKEAVEIVTVQGALEQIGGLEDKELVTSRLFDYIVAVTPQGVGYNTIRFDTTMGTIGLVGNTVSREKANELANNVKNASFSYTQNDQKQTLKPFSVVVFTGLSLNENNQDNRNVSFELTFQIDMLLFNRAIEDGKVETDAAGRLLPEDEQPFSLVEGEPEE